MFPYQNSCDKNGNPNNDIHNLDPKLRAVFLSGSDIMRNVRLKKMKIKDTEKQIMQKTRKHIK